MSAARTKSKEEGSAGNGNPGEAQEGTESNEAPKDPREQVTGNEEEDEDEEETEEILKYTRVTSSLSSVYRNGDSTSCFASSGDQLILGTHNGVVHVFSISTLQPIRSYRAHSASVSAISVSPFSPTLSPSDSSEATNTSGSTHSSPAAKSLSNLSPNSGKTQAKRAPPAVPQSLIYIATASIDGHVCVSSLTDTKEVTLRNYARPVHAVALSPDYKNDHTYLSGGVAGSLVLTTGGRVGVSTDANTNSAAAAASGWLGSIGLGSSSGKDTVLHSGEGNISNIKWSLSGKFVAFSNEEGIRILRSHLDLPSALSESAWKSIGFVAKPNQRSWRGDDGVDMAGVWKAHLEWVDEAALETLENQDGVANGSSTAPNKSSPSRASLLRSASKATKVQKEKLLIGWGDTVWMLEVQSDSTNLEDKAKALGTADFLRSRLQFPDDVIAGLSLYTPSLLLVLVYRTRDDKNRPIANNNDNTPRKGGRRRQNGLPPELRLIDLSASDSVTEDVSLTVSRFESLSATDYHLSTIFVEPKPPSNIRPTAKSTFESFGGLRDVSFNPTRLFSSGASMVSGSSSGDKVSVSTDQPASIRGQRAPVPKESLAALTNPGLKIFIQSPFDSVLAIKRDLTDRLQWMLEHEQYKEAWELVDINPHVISGPKSTSSRTDSRPSTPTKNPSLADFFADDTASESTVPTEPYHLAVAKEKRRIGDLWVQQLVEAGKWSDAGRIAGQVLGNSLRWEHWILTFAQANKFDDITPYIPSHPLKPPLPTYVYDMVLGHYIEHDRLRMKELLDQWHPGLYDIPSVVSVIDTKLEVGDIRKDTLEDDERGRDWRLLLEALAKLYLLDSRPTEAFRCFLYTRNADAAFELVREYHLFDAISSDIWPFVQLRVPRDSSSLTLEDLSKLSTEAIHLLCSAAISGIISASTVISQLEDEYPTARPYLFFYLRALWLGDSAMLKDADASTIASASRVASIRRGRFSHGQTANLVAESTSRTLLEQHADLAVSLFAEYDRALLDQLLRQSRAYTFEHADAVCEQRGLVPELVHLLSTTGQSVRALHLIIDKLGDVGMAIDFAKEVDEPSLWDELLEYSMDKPAFVRGLLEDVGTAIDPVRLVKGIPEGLEVEGLKGGLSRIVHESEVMFSIAEGAAKVMRGEVGGELELLQKGRLKGVVFDGAEDVAHLKEGEATEAKSKGCCSICDMVYFPSADVSAAAYDIESDPHADHLLGFPCGHIFHLTCILDAITTPENKSIISKLQRDLASSSGERDAVGKVRQKVAHAQMIKTCLGDSQACLACARDIHVSNDSLTR